MSQTDAGDREPIPARLSFDELREPAGKGFRDPIAIYEGVRSS